MCTYKPKSLLEKITERALECTNTSQEIPEYIQTVASCVLDIIDYDLDMEILDSGVYNKNGNYQLRFARFGIEKTELLIYGNAKTGDLSLSWDKNSLEGYIRKEFFIPFKRESRFPTIESLLARMKLRIRYYIGEDVIIQAPAGENNLVTMYTKNYTVSFTVKIIEVPNTLLLNYIVTYFSLIERTTAHAIRGGNRKKNKALTSITKHNKKDGF